MSIRDVSLILIGAALAKSDRDRIVNSCTPGSLDKDAERCLQAIRDNDKGRVVSWFADIGVTIDRGRDAIQSCVDRVLDEQKKQRMRSMVQELNYAFKVEDVAELRERLSHILSQLESL